MTGRCCGQLVAELQPGWGQDSGKVGSRFLPNHPKERESFWL